MVSQPYSQSAMNRKSNKNFTDFLLIVVLLLFVLYKTQKIIIFTTENSIDISNSHQ